MEDFGACCDRAFELLGPEADAILIVPPFADIRRPSLGVHLLQACAEQAGLRVRILYANLLFAALSGEELYDTICYSPFRGMLGERIFTASAFGLPPLGRRLEEIQHKETLEGIAALEREAAGFCGAIGRRFGGLRCHVAGATTTFHQTAASVALLREIKLATPKVITVIGGANCEGAMALGIVSLRAPINYVFSGESESSFTGFLRRVVAGKPLPADPIICGEPCFDMEALPEPNFDDYFAQLEDVIPTWRETAQIWLPCESSRGCWWGARQHCTFCGLNGETMAFREKSPDRVISGLQRLLSRYPTRLVCMIDNIMPHSYFRTVLPRLAEELPPAHIFYETKSNLTLEQVELLRRAGVGLIQPGIEALSSSLLRRMKKGVLARQNVALLRYARACGLAVNWNLLYGFPGDHSEDYAATLALIPLIRHLYPPTGIYPVSIDRFSPYFKRPADYGISGLRPLPEYEAVFPEGTDFDHLAYHFTGEYECAESEDSLAAAFREWRACWKVDGPPPTLNLAAVGGDHYLLMDTRGLNGTGMLQFLDQAEARTVLIGGPVERQPLAAWAIERKLAVALDDWCVPLAVTEPELWRRFLQPNVSEPGPTTRAQAELVTLS